MTMILVSYDGSTDARPAIERAAQLLPGADATILTARAPFVDLILRSGAMGVLGSIA